VHEMSYCEGVLEAVERRAAGRAVSRVGVRIGAVHRGVADAVEGGDEVVLEWIAYADGPHRAAVRPDELVPAHTHQPHDHHRED
jgi:hypothetical protein